MKNSRNLLGAGSLVGDKVVNKKNEYLGRIEELMISVKDGQVAYAVMSFGGFLSFGNKFFAVPWMALTVDEKNQCFVIDIDKDVLKNAPGFDKDHWPDMIPEWDAEISTYYKQHKKEKIHQ